MKSYKFRIWNKVKKHWHINEFNLLGEISLMGDVGFDFTDDKPIRLQELNDLVVMQYTGMNDKNGKEIYEGDIIKSEDHNPKHMWIDFVEGGFVAQWNEKKDYPTDINHFYPSVGCCIEVVGNIWENEPLLKGEDK